MIYWILAAQGWITTCIYTTHTPYTHAKINVSLQNNYAVYNKCTQSSLQVALEIKQGIWYKRAFISMCRARTVGYFVIDRRRYATSVSCLAIGNEARLLAVSLNNLLRRRSAI